MNLIRLKLIFNEKEVDVTDDEASIKKGPICGEPCGANWSCPEGLECQMNHVPCGMTCMKNAREKSSKQGNLIHF